MLNTKSGKLREIPMTPSVRSALEDRRRENPAAELGSLYVFCGPSGQPWVELSFRFESALRKANISDFRWHDMRQTLASHMVMSGADIQTVQELLGHSDLQMTMKSAHLAPNHKKAAIQGLGEHLAEPINAEAETAEFQGS